MQPLPLILLAATLLAAGEPVAATPPALASGLEMPESIVEHPRTQALYCSNIGGAGAADATPVQVVTGKDGNGFISRVNPDGSVAELRFLPGAGEPRLNGPKGLAIVGDALWIADIDRVVEVDLASRKTGRVVDLVPHGVTFANDLCFDGATLFCSDTAGDQVLAISGVAGPGAVTVKSLKHLPGANGLARAPGGPLLVAGFPLADLGKPDVTGRVWSSDLEGPPDATPFPRGLWDGIAIHAGTTYVTDWAANALWVLDIGAAEPRKLVDGLAGPADLCVLADGSAALVPEMLANRIRRVALK